MRSEAYTNNIRIACRGGYLPAIEDLFHACKESIDVVLLGEKKGAVGEWLDWSIENYAFLLKCPASCITPGRLTEILESLQNIESLLYLSSTVKKVMEILEDIIARNPATFPPGSVVQKEAIKMRKRVKNIN